MEKLDPRTWLEEAKKLAVGQTNRIDHDCGSGRTLLVQHKEQGWDAWCHRCNMPGWVPHPPESVHEKIARLRVSAKADAVVRENPSALPGPAVHDVAAWPVAARVWLYKAGMTPQEIKDAGFYYHERTQRVVLPIRGRDREVLYWQARGFDKDRPKYINPRVDKNNLLARYLPPGCGEGSRGDASPHTRGDCVVLTEDILSAWKCAHRGDIEAWCMLGTNLPDSIFQEALDRKLTVFVWLDPDGAGVRGANKALRRLRAYGLKCIRVESLEDPKLLQGHIISRSLA